MKQPMTKIEEDKIKWIEKIETVYPETIQLPNYQYWNSQNTLDYNISLRNKPVIESWQFYIWNTTITSTGNKSITGVWFKPKIVRFIVWDNVWNPSYVSIWAMTTQWQYAMNFQTSACDNGRCIHLWTKCWAVYVSMDTDWFTINCNYWTNTAYVTYECYW